MSSILALNDFFQGLSKCFGKEVLNAKTILKIYYKFSLVYLGT